MFNQPSTILRLIQEAEDIKVTPAEDELDQLPSGAGVSDVTSELTAANPTAPELANAQQNPTFQVGSIPQNPNNVATTLNKTVVNTEVIQSQLSELKSLINNYEKKFEDSDISIENSKVYVGSLLNALIYHSEKLQAFLGLQDPQVAMGVEPVAAPTVPTEPEALSKPPIPGL